MLDTAKEQTEEPAEGQSSEPSNSAERRRGILEAHHSVALLQKRWPALFRDDARPLASSCVAEIATAMGWSIQFTRPAVLRWKRSYRYCQAILKHTERVHLDGSLSGEMVDDQARVLARAQLDRKQGGPRAPARAPQPAPSIAAPAAPPPPAATAAVQPEAAPAPTPAPAKPSPEETRRAAQLKLMQLAKRRVRR